MRLDASAKYLGGFGDESASRLGGWQDSRWGRDRDGENIFEEVRSWFVFCVLVFWCLVSQGFRSLISGVPPLS